MSENLCNINPTRKVLFEKFSEEILFEELFIENINKCKFFGRNIRRGYSIYVDVNKNKILFEINYTKKQDDLATFYMEKDILENIGLKNLETFQPMLKRCCNKYLNMELNRFNFTILSSNARIHYQE